MRPDLELLRRSVGNLDEIVTALELELVDDPRWSEPSDTSYLNERDRADPDIMANVDAMRATNELIDWFARDMEGFVGFWRGPECMPVEQAPVVRLDTEGQYELVGVTIGDYFVSAFDDEEFDERRETLTAEGFTVAESPDALWDALKPFVKPNGYRHTLYNEGRVKRGLPAIPE